MFKNIHDNLHCFVNCPPLHFIYLRQHTCAHLAHVEKYGQLLGEKDCRDKFEKKIYLKEFCTHDFHIIDILAMMRLLRVCADFIGKGSKYILISKFFC